MGGEQETHRSSIDDQNKDFSELKKKKAKLQSERNNKNQNASSEHKEQNEKTNGRMKAMRRQLDEAEEKTRDEQEEVERDKAETEEDEDLCVIGEDKEEEVGEDAKDWNVLPPEKLDEVREQKQADQRTQLEEMEDELQQTEDQNM